MKRLAVILLILGLCTAVFAASDQPLKTYRVDVCSYTDTENPTVQGQDIVGAIRVYNLFLVNPSSQTFQTSVYDGETKLFTVQTDATENVDLNFDFPLNIRTGIRTVAVSEDALLQEVDANYTYRKFNTAEGKGQSDRVYSTTTSSGVCTAISVACYIDKIVISPTTTAQTISLRNETCGNALMQLYCAADTVHEKDYYKTPLYFSNGVAVISSAAADDCNITFFYRLAMQKGSSEWQVACSTAVLLGAASTNNIGGSNIDIEVACIDFQSQSTAATQYIYSAATKIFTTYEADDTNVTMLFDPYVVFTSSMGFYSSSATTPPKVNVIYRRN